MSYDGRRIMKALVRSITKRVFYKLRPVLGAGWFAVKYLEYFALYPLLALLPLRLAHFMMRLRSPWMLLLPSEKQSILENLERTVQAGLPGKDIHSLAKIHVRFLSSVRFDTKVSSLYSTSDLENFVRFHGLSRIDEAQRNGRGVILVGSHSGYPYRCAFALARMGYRLNIITMRPRDTSRIVWRGMAGVLLYSNLLRNLQKAHIHILYVGEAAHEIAQRLEHKEILVTMLDNPLPPEDPKGVKVPFLGMHCCVSGQLFRMAHTYNAVCLPYIIEVTEDVCLTTIHPPWEPGNAKETAEDRVSAQVMHTMQLFEQHILAHPEQWWLWRDLRAFSPRG